MNWILANLRWLGLLAISMLGLTAGLIIWQQHNTIAGLQKQLDASNTQRDALSGQLETAQLTLSTKDGQIITLVDLNRQQAADVAAQLQRLDTITRNATARAIRLEALTHEDPDAKSWGDTRLPDAVARLLDNTATGSDTAGPPDRAAALPAGGGVQAAGQPPENQPPAGAEPAGNPPSP
jgi:LysB family phage lysis regulatory protein